MKRSILTASVVVFLLCFSVAANAAARSAQSGGDSAQIDGITNQVVGQLWDRTDYYWHRGDYPRIVALDRIITQADPHFLEPYATGGWLLESMGDNKDAEAYYKQGIANNPNRSYMYYSLGFFYYNTLHNYPKAVSTFQKDVKVADADVNDWKMLAHSYEHIGRIDDAVDAWKVIKHRYPTAPAVDYNLNKDLKLQAARKAAPGPQASAAR